jgi:integrase
VSDCAEGPCDYRLEEQVGLPQVIPANPCTRIKLPKPRKRVVEPLSAAAVLALLDAITPRYRVAVALGAGLGLREGEAFGLTVPRVDFLRRKVQVMRKTLAAGPSTRFSRWLRRNRDGTRKRGDDCAAGQRREKG